MMVVTGPNCRLGTAIRLCLLVLACGLFAGTGHAAESPAARAALRRLLSSADLKGRQALLQARQRFQSARGACSDDRLARHAYGVVLAGMHQLADAESHLTEAVQPSGAAYPPALRAGLYVQLHLRHWAPATETARLFGQALGEHPGSWANAEALQSDARWLGQAVSAAQLLASTGDDVKLWADVDRDLRQKLPQALASQYTAGFEATLDLRTKLVAEVEAARSEAQEQQAEAQEAERKSLKEQKQLTTANRENLKVAAELTKKQFDLVVAEFARQLGQMEKEWTQLDERRESLDRSIFLISQEMAVLQQQYDLLAQQAKNSRNAVNAIQLRMQGIDQQLAARQLQLLEYQADRNRTVISMGGIYQQAMSVLAERQATAAEYERQTGQIQKRDELLEKWKTRLEKQATELEQEDPKGNTVGVLALERKLQTVAAYLSFDWEAERQRLLAEWAD